MRFCCSLLMLSWQLTKSKQWHLQWKKNADARRSEFASDWLRLPEHQDTLQTSYETLCISIIQGCSLLPSVADELWVLSINTFPGHPCMSVQSGTRTPCETLKEKSHHNAYSDIKQILIFNTQFWGVKRVSQNRITMRLEWHPVP